jgi:hypothetical protein
MAIKVGREKLIAAVTAKLAVERKEFDKQKDEYDAAFGPYKAAVVEGLAEAARQVKMAKSFEHLAFLNPNKNYNAVAVVVGKSVPYPVQKPERITRMEHMLKQLEICSDEVLTLKDDDAYLRYI